MFELKTVALFFITAIAEIVGCYLPSLWLKENKSAWLLSLHPAATGRVYAAYGGLAFVLAENAVRVPAAAGAAGNTF